MKEGARVYLANAGDRNLTVGTIRGRPHKKDHAVEWDNGARTEEMASDLVEVITTDHRTRSMDRFDVGLVTGAERVANRVEDVLRRYPPSKIKTAVTIVLDAVREANDQLTAKIKEEADGHGLRGGDVPEHQGDRAEPEADRRRAGES